jgi:Myb-like DNA-binding domain
VKKLGYSWKQIAQYIPDKSARQIGDRFHNVLKAKMAVAKSFSALEDKKLLACFERTPNQWKEISKYFPGRNEAMIKD